MDMAVLKTILVLLFPLTGVHMLAMAGTALASGITVRQVSIGLGPVLFTWGRFQLHVLPLSGFLRLLDSREEPLPDHEIDTARAFNHRPVWIQLAVVLSGCAALMAVGMLGLGTQAWHGVLTGFTQIVLGALEPFSYAQQLLAQLNRYALTHSPLELFALLAVKTCAANLLPYPGSSGLQALLTLVRGGRPSLSWETRVSTWLFWPMLVIWLSWALALGVYLF